MYFYFVAEGMYWLCHKRQTTNTLHAWEHTVLPVQDVEVCGISSVWVLHHDHDCSQHRGTHDEGKKAYE